ncbi:MAG: hypothetical protein IKK82_03075 [Kiritimatiellae bacterium]|nr:hypothetical protein [Kiritimatiellia bacterium]
MKTLIVIALAALSVTTLAAEETKEPTTKKTNKEIMDHISMKRYGGKIRQPNSERGEIVFVNSQKTVEASVLAKAIDKIERQFKYIVKVSDKDVDASASRLVVRLEDLDRKERVLLAPESYWVSVNVKSLAADNPPKAILADRFEKEVRRAFAFVCGGTCGTEPGGICRMVDSLSDLDAIPGLDFALDIEARIVNNMNETEVKPYRIAKYSEAVQEGWAPAPTNEFQKAIWDKVHAMPAEPLKIKPETKKQEK